MHASMPKIKVQRLTCSKLSVSAQTTCAPKQLNRMLAWLRTNHYQGGVSIWDVDEQRSKY